MYLFFGILILFLILCSLLSHYRKKYICKKIRCMTVEEKCFILNSITESFGYCYDICSDLFITTIDAWQKNFGYCRLYDEAATSMNMVFDYEPIYFDYQNRTWLIEFWKGQYGINTGAEVGIYCTDTILHERELSTTLFFGVAESEMLPISYELLDKENRTVFQYSQKHWWLGAFRMGLFSYPENLRLKISLTFPNEEMKRNYINGLLRTGYSVDEIYVCRQTVGVYFTSPKTTQPLRKLHARITQWKNKKFIQIYHHFTKPFIHNADRLIYLYYFAPPLFRGILSSRGKYRRIHKKTVKKAKKFV